MLVALQTSSESKENKEETYFDNNSMTSLSAWSCMICTFVNTDFNVGSLVPSSVSCSICGHAREGKRRRLDAANKDPEIFDLVDDDEANTIGIKHSKSHPEQAIKLQVDDDDADTKPPAVDRKKQEGKDHIVVLSDSEDESSTYQTPKKSSPQRFVVIDLCDDNCSPRTNDSFSQRVASSLEKVSRLTSKSLRQIRLEYRRNQELARKFDAEERGMQSALQVCGEHVENDLALAQALQAIEDENSRKTAVAEETFDVLRDFRKDIHELLKKQATSLNIVAIEENPCSRTGNALYNKFVESWQRVQDQSVVLAFHGTFEANIEPICRNGLDPKLRAGQALGAGEYFARDASTSVPYCRGGKKMLVFAVLTDKGGVTADKNGILVINKPDHQLPLFVLTFSSGPTTTGPIVPFPPPARALAKLPSVSLLPLVPDPNAASGSS